MRRDAFQAIADPTRRAILSMIAYRPLSVNAVAGKFEVSRTAIYKHVKILTECGMVVIRQRGRDRYCEARLKKLNEVTTWIEQHRSMWADRFENMTIYLEDIKKQKKKNGTHKRSKKRYR
jgi:DNA-binding transcriptional ArsR family regulator